jgi:anthranilate phosphoribosyltransferase
MNVGPVIDQLLSGVDLDSMQAQDVMAFLISGEASEAQIAGILVALKSKGASGGELAAFARAMRASALTLDHDFPQLIDTCGTGGGIPSFNISTATAVLIAAAGGRVAKHGNRGVTSSCGSVDVLEALGAKIELDPAQNIRNLGEVGLAFLFAPTHHAAMRHVGPTRRALATRTVFNQLGPLANPAGANRQLIGVYDPSLLAPMAEALAALGCERGLVVHGANGMDEVSPCGPTLAFRVWRGMTEPVTLELSEFGLEAVSPEALLPGETAAENAAILREAISEVGSPRCAAVLPSAAAALWLAGLAEVPAVGVELARELIASGAATRKLDEFIEATHR